MPARASPTRGMAEVRIQKALADAGLASRRAAESLVEAGRVSVNGVPAAIGQRVDPASDRITVDGRPIPAASHHVYLAVNKPAGVTSTVSDRHAERTVLELVPRDQRRSAGRLYPVGRLDRDSEGLLLLTNDGDWAQRVLHPRFGVEREYAIGLEGELTSAQARRLSSGIELEEGIGRLGGVRRATAPETRALHAITEAGSQSLAWYRATLQQGWRRQLRRMFTAVGAPVVRLVRVRIGTLRLEGAPGSVRELGAKEAGRLAGTAASQGGLGVTLDGPGSSGKSSVGAAAAGQLRYRFCDTGVLYRALTWLAFERAVDLDDSDALVGLVPAITLVEDDGGRLTHVRIEGADVTIRIHTERVDRQVSRVARQPQVREALLPRQRELADGGRIIMAGRDIGTVVLPDADLKLYLDVSVEERARRRAEERGIPLGSAAAAAVEAELRRRDGIDSNRETAPLRIPDGAVIIRSGGNTLEQTVAVVVDAVRQAERRTRT
jgi:23S rRNA pseudouridine2605 synthase